MPKHLPLPSRNYSIVFSEDVADPRKCEYPHSAGIIVSNCHNYSVVKGDRRVGRWGEGRLLAVHSTKLFGGMCFWKPPLPRNLTSLIALLLPGICRSWGYYGWGVTFVIACQKLRIICYLLIYVISSLRLLRWPHETSFSFFHQL